MISRVIFSALFIKHYFQEWIWGFKSSMFVGIYISLILDLCFSLCRILLHFLLRCLPSGWTVLLFSGVITLISEKLFLDHKNFWPAFKIHFSISLSCFCIASFIMWVSPCPFISFNLCYNYVNWLRCEYNWSFNFSYALLIML